MGAWIETNGATVSFFKALSHPTWVRGLKHVKTKVKTALCKSHPTWVRGLKLVNSTLQGLRYMSHPTWVRGLKHISVKLVVN